MSNNLNLDNAYALLVGVGGENMDATVADAKALHKILVDEKLAAYPEKNVYLLTGKQATRENVVKRLDLIANKVKGKEDATVFVYYSGHGGRFEKTQAGKTQYGYYLLTHGFDLEKPEETMLNGDIFSSKIDHIAAEKLIVLLDCCHAAGIRRTRSLTTKSLAKKANQKIKYSNEELIAKLKGGRGRVFISSCADNEESVILPGAVNSLFTQVTLDALSGVASKGSHFVRVIDLMYHLLLTVPQKVAPYDHQQNPVINEVQNLNGTYMLCLNGNKAVAMRKKAATRGPETTTEDKMKFINNYSNKFVIKGSVTNVTNINTVNRNFTIGQRKDK